MENVLKRLANNGVLRVAINTGNGALVQMVDGVPQGGIPSACPQIGRSDWCKDGGGAF
jgi:hypothetical protein